MAGMWQDKNWNPHLGLLTILQQTDPVMGTAANTRVDMLCSRCHSTAALSRQVYYATSHALLFLQEMVLHFLGNLLCTQRPPSSSWVGAHSSPRAQVGSYLWPC